MPDATTYQPHRWKYDRLNRFWAHCNCGYSAYGFFDTILVRRMNKHVREATENDYRAAQIEQMRRGTDA